jgi:hypothetical protein
VHLGLRIWGLNTGWNHGLRVAASLNNPILRYGGPHVARLAAFAAGIGLPLALGRVVGPGRTYAGVVLAAAILGAVLIVRLRTKVEGWRLTLVVLAIFVIISVVR